jgi:hypothetical protein
VCFCANTTEGAVYFAREPVVATADGLRLMNPEQTFVNCSANGRYIPELPLNRCRLDNGVGVIDAGRLPIVGQGDSTMVRNSRLLIALGFMLTVACANIYAQQTVYKWVDEDGVVHFSEEPPNVSSDIKVEVITTDPSPPSAPRASTTVKSAPPTTAQVEKQSAKPEAEIPPLVKEVDITEMSLEELDRRCEHAREAMIAPLREAEIEKCIQTGTGDRPWCETFWADYGEPVRTKSGTFTPAMFHDLPECLDAFNERNRRGLYPE